MCHESGSQLVWQFPRLPMIVVEEEEDQIVTLVYHLKGALSQSHLRIIYANMNILQVFSR